MKQGNGTISMGNKSALAAALAVACGALPTTAHADVLPVEITYSNGATFAGDVTFSADFSRITAVNGVLTGYGTGSTVYTPGATTVINAVWAGGNIDVAGGPQNYGTYLYSTAGGGFGSNWMRFAYNFANAPTLDFANTGGFQNGVNVFGPAPAAFASGGLAVVGGVPEPTTWLLFILGFGVVGASLRQQRARRRTASVNFAFA